jgi:hypothetical protein
MLWWPEMASSWGLRSLVDITGGFFFPKNPPN